MTTTTYTRDTYRLLAAFHSAMLLRRIPTAATQDGHRKFFSLDLLVLENRIETGADLCALAREARRMTRQGLLVHRRLFARDFWMMTPAGAHMLRRETDRTGLTGVLDAALAREQAAYDAEHAANVATEAQIYFEAAVGNDGLLLSEDALLLYAVLNGRAAQ
jgi:hypothetical protein